MLNVPAKLATREQDIRVGVVGTGLFGTKLIDQVATVPGMDVVCVADIDEQKARDALAEAGLGKAVAVETSGEADDVIDRGDRAVLADGLALAATDVDVVVEATGVPDAGAGHAYRALSEGTHVVNVTVETWDAVTVAETFVRQLRENPDSVSV